MSVNFGSLLSAGGVGGFVCLIIPCLLYLYGRNWILSNLGYKLNYSGVIDEKCKSFVVAAKCGKLSDPKDMQYSNSDDVATTKFHLSKLSNLHIFYPDENLLYNREHLLEIIRDSGWCGKWLNTFSRLTFYLFFGLIYCVALAITVTENYTDGVVNLPIWVLTILVASIIASVVFSFYVAYFFLECKGIINKLITVSETGDVAETSGAAETGDAATN